MTITRRKLACQSFNTIFAYSISQLLISENLLADKRSMALDDWLDLLIKTGNNLLEGRDDSLGWQTIMDKIYGAVNINELIAHIDLDKVRKKMDYSRKSECFIRHPLGFPGENLGSDKRQVVTKIAGVQAGGAVPPHGHENMVSAFLILDGELRVRQFDRLGETGGHVLVKPTVNELQRAGQWSSISDHKNNCHWLESTGGEALFFSTKVVELDVEKNTRGRIHFDYNNASKLGNSVLKAKKISYQEAIEKYTM